MDEPPFADPSEMMQSLKAMFDQLGEALAPIALSMGETGDPKDRRFAGSQWDHPVFDLIRKSYLMTSDHMMGAIDAVPGLEEQQRARMRFAMQMIVDAMSPANSPFTNPVALERAFDTGGASLMSGLEHLAADLQRGQITHTKPDAFTLGENIAATPGEVIYQTPLFQLIHYAPTGKTVLETPLLIFPPWINRFYILDLTAEKSFIGWCVAQGISVFVVSWKSADRSMRDIIWDDYISAQIEAIDVVRDLLSVQSVHIIGYCVAGTTLAATLAVLAAKGEADKVKSATFFTAQVDFSEAGDLLHFVDDALLPLVEVASEPGYVDGRALAMTFNMLRGNDLIWSTVVKNYLLGEEYPAFDLLHWNGDVTNLPAKWHSAYLRDLFRDNLLVVPGALSALGVPIDLTRVETPCYVQAGREDHIAPPKSVWKIRDYFGGPVKFMLAGSGHIAGVVNPPSAHKYQYWTNDGDAASLDEFIAGATETKGSWWGDWLSWLENHGADRVAAKRARIPGKGPLRALEAAPGSYVKVR